MPVPSWGWQTAAGPPGSRVSATAATEPTAEVQIVLPGPGERVGFDAHIKTLFRERDRRSMLFAFDLWKQQDVADNAAAILARLRDGSMPCDGVWPEEHIDAFARWIDDGTTP